VARAVRRLPVLVEYLLPLVRVGGFALAQKGEGAEREAEEAKKAIQVLGGGLNKVTTVDIPGVDEQRYLLVIEKVASTPEKYPRREGIPAKRPII
jgi:16S rRNA (guanine527-N7)-methyltransferase